MVALDGSTGGSLTFGELDLLAFGGAKEVAQRGLEDEVRYWEGQSHDESEAGQNIQYGTIVPRRYPWVRSELRSTVLIPAAMWTTLADRR
jgi:hypothetical protein